MIFLFRVDVSPNAGMGHFSRCKVLADELKSRGNKIIFLINHSVEFINFILVNSGYDVRFLSEDYHDSQIEDAKESIRLLEGITCDYIIVDNYELDERWESYVRPYTKNIVVIDDNPKRKHECDILLDQNIYSFNAREKYLDLLPKNCKILLGPKFALLDPLYSLLRENLLPRSNKIKSVLVFFGGSDSNGHTLSFLKALSRTNFIDLEIDVVVGPQNKHVDEIKSYTKEIKNVNVLPFAPSLAPLILNADLFIGAGGTTTWERCCLGIPSLVTWVSENQRESTELLHSMGVQYSLGNANEITAEKWVKVLNDYIKEPAKIVKAPNDLMKIVDGKGVCRFTRLVTQTSRNINFRYAKKIDLQVLSDYKKKSVINDDKINQDNDKNYFICQDERKIPIGYLMMQNSPDDILIEFGSEKFLDEYMVEKDILRATFFEIKESVEKNKINIFNDCFIYQKKFFKSKNYKKSNPKLTILSSPKSWINNRIPELLIKWLREGYCVRWIFDASQLISGDVCFVLGFDKILNNQHLSSHKNTLVIHESALPNGRGWSPMSWQVLEGANKVTVSLIEANEAVDQGDIYLQTYFSLDGTELVNELREKQANSTIKLCNEWLKKYPSIKNMGNTQTGQISYYKKRTPVDSKLNPDLSITKLFNLLRIVDNKNYPAWFELRGNNYRLSINKVKNK